MEPATGFVIVAGERIAVDLPVITFRDAGGFDASAKHRWFRPDERLPSRPAAGCDTTNRFSARRVEGFDPTSADSVRQHVDLFVLHYDVAITSSNCFRVLQDLRGLSVHFLLDVDGTLYQTADLAVRARHAGAANDRSIGIEIAHPGAHATEEAAGRSLDTETGALVPPRRLEPPPGGPFRPDRPGFVTGRVHGGLLYQHDFTAAQYATLAQLIAEMERALGIPARAPRTVDGSVRTDALSGEELAAFSGVIGHFHVSRGKVDPGPAFDWERVLPGPRGAVP